MSEHTPGPWEITASGEIKHLGLLIAGVHGATSPMGDANAQLIASAPEMLETLEAIIDPTRITDTSEFIAHIQGVITKARGE